MALTLVNTTTPVDQLYPAYQNGFVSTLVSGATLTATASTAVFQVPYIAVNAKARLIVNISAISGTTPTLTLGYFESADGTTTNPTAVLTTAALSATGETWVTAATGPVFNQGILTATISGTTPSVTFSAWLAVWNK